MLITTMTGCGGSKHKGQAGRENSITVGVKDTTIQEKEITEFSTVQSDEYPFLSGDTLCEYDGKAVLHHLIEDDDNIQSVSFSEITTYAGNKLVSTCKVKGYNNLVSADGNTLMIVLGVDTLRYNISSLPETIYPLKDLVGKDATECSVKHNFPAGDTSRLCSFNLTAHLSYDRPEYINRVIAAIMYSDFQLIFEDVDIRPDIMEEYQQLGKNPNRYSGLNTSKVSPKEIGDYFARKFEKLYRKQFAEEINEGWGPQEEYLLDVAPVWKNDDGRISTYRFYTYHYGGGAHGMMNEFYLSFDNNDGRVLGYEDILGNDRMRQTIPILNKKLNNRLSHDTDYSDYYSADLGKEGKNNYNDHMLNEIFEGYVYPRVALTRNGMVFTYQPYDKGSFADGILHITLPNFSK